MHYTSYKAEVDATIWTLTVLPKSHRGQVSGWCLNWIFVGPKSFA